MKNIGLQVFKFLIEFVWSKINLREFLSKFKYLLVLLLSNAILSVLFIYMAEQTIKRTNEARKLRSDIVTLNGQLATCNAQYDQVNQDLQNTKKLLGVIKNTVKPEDMVDEYNSWVNQLERQKTQLAAKTTVKGTKK